MKANTYGSVNLIVDNNVFYNCEKFTTRALYTNYFTYTNNLLVFPRERQLTFSGLYDMVAGLDMYVALKKAVVKISNNLVQGSGGCGFVMAATNCGQNSGFQNNQVQSAKYIGLIVAGNGTCLEATDIVIAKTRGGIWSNFGTGGFSLKRIILAENEIGMQLMFGRESDDNSFYFEKIDYIALARQNCSYCYQDASSCSNQIATLVPLNPIHGKSIPIDKPTPMGLTSICTDQSFDQKFFMKDTKFINYKLDYSKDQNPLFKACANNRMIHMRNDPDSHAIGYVTTTKRVNSDLEALAVFLEPDQSQLFWRGGCGDFNCTAVKNWMLHDLDGSLLGKIGEILPRNEGINPSWCKAIKEWNGQICDDIRFGTLEFQNDGPDQRLRIVAPVNISSQNLLNDLNEWREWKWEGPEPLNKRLARFAGIIELNTTSTLNFETTVPEELKFKLQKGRPQLDYAIISIKYERPNIIEVWNMINGSFIKPYRVDQNIDLTTKWNQCGANIYDFDNRTIQFVITNGDDCKLKVRTINSVRISIRMDSTIDEFYCNNGEALFIDKIAAFLKIDPARIRIVNVQKGSVIINFEVVENKKLTDSTSALDTEETQPIPINVVPVLKSGFDGSSSFNENQNENNLASSSDVPQLTAFIPDKIIDLIATKAELEDISSKLELALKTGELSLPAQFKSISSTVIVPELEGATRKLQENKENEVDAGFWRDYIWIMVVFAALTIMSLIYIQKRRKVGKAIHVEGMEVDKEKGEYIIF